MNTPDREQALGGWQTIEIQQRLSAIEKVHGVTILLAVESGSRAWGHPSPDSDFDVRFVFVRPSTGYIRLRQPRDVIEEPADPTWDINGWDIGKALALLEKGNPSIIEWLRSPIVYREHQTITDTMRTLVADIASPEQSARHYYGLLRSTWFNEFGDRTEVRLKQYLYGVRAAAALAFVRTEGRAPPMDLPSLMPSIEPTVAASISEIVARKAAATEGAKVVRIPILDAYMHDTLFAPERPDFRFRPATDFEAKADAIIRAAVAYADEAAPDTVSTNELVLFRLSGTSASVGWSGPIVERYSEPAPVSTNEVGDE